MDPHHAAGEEAQGIRAASEIYFSKSPKDISITEAAMLVGMLQNSSYFNPLRRPETVLKRRSVVLKQMERNGAISRVQYDSLKQTPLGLHFTRQSHIDGLAPYFRMELAKEVKNILNRPEFRKPDGSSYDIYRDGLRIYTTIDPKLQELAEEEMTKHMKQLQKTFFKHWSKRDPWTYRSGSETEVPIEISRDFDSVPEDRRRAILAEVNVALHGRGQPRVDWQQYRAQVEAQPSVTSMRFVHLEGDWRFDGGNWRPARR